MNYHAGRSCPIDYRYRPEDIALQPPIATEVLYVIGGLYGNLQALDAIFSLAKAEKGAVTFVFNGDFNWFNCDPALFLRLNKTVLSHYALRGNVETELTQHKQGGDCGCAYPDFVDEDVVIRSNMIITVLNETAQNFPHIQKQFAELPRYLRFLVGEEKVGIVHGDPISLSGWGFGIETLREIGAVEVTQDWFIRADVSIFASTHTCLPVFIDRPFGMLLNNGTSGMPNFNEGRAGLLTRISTLPYLGNAAVYHNKRGATFIDMLAIDYNHALFLADFDRQWPKNSPAELSYRNRIINGTNLTLNDAVL